MYAQPTVVIIGAGMIGLASALAIQSVLPKGSYKMLLVAREFPSQADHSVDYASMWAGAHMRPIPASTPQLAREAEWLRRTVVVFDSQSKEKPWRGVTATTGTEYLDAPDEFYQAQNKASFTAETGAKMGFTYSTFCVNPPVYCASLLRTFLLRGGSILRQSLASEWEGFTITGCNVRVVVNASGIGFDDPECFPTRGQTILTNLTSVKQTVTRQNEDGTWSFIIPRMLGGGTVIGGTKEPNNLQVEPRPSTRHQLLSNFSKNLDMAELRYLSKDLLMDQDIILRDIVGRRPTRRGGMRVGVAKATKSDVNRVNHESASQSVVHAYGAGGRGYEISWGVAQEVAGLVKQELSTTSSADGKWKDLHV
ncbi:FAD dependent oxidoreductase [Penicillium camemberti]|uniref:FAD dependent oxidoreductase n=1 Tax=Penicillium camemberti (strain FM 013) TaxID=1429867 RepID=A0A0G4PDP3_PENC3|nr:FAD dependent oxidoreductase [Penicillium camemberti]